MESQGLNSLLDALSSTKKSQDYGSRPIASQVTDMEIDPQSKKTISKLAASQKYAPKQTIDLEQLIFQQGSHLMSNSKCRLPVGSTKKSKKGYEEIHVPPPKTSALAPNEKSIAITDMESWAQKAFKGAKSLNRIQSRVYPCAFQSDENMLICAPTGAGKVFFSLT